MVAFQDHGRLARLTLSRPPVNVLNIAMMRAINDCLTSLQSRGDLCALLIDADGPVFSAGVDVPEHRRETVEQMIGTFHQTIRLIDDLPMPVVAAVHGGAYGGGMELAVFCDIILASDDLKIGVPEISLGVYPPVAVAYLSRLVGYHRAAELILTGRILSAEEAHAMGLVNHVFPSADFRRQVTEYMGQLTRHSAFSLRNTRRALRRASLPTFEDSLAAAESIYLRDLMSGSDPIEGLNAFVEKRPPVWNDR
jgi:cyclohexa-1,5-dienecarbonyl-CoA hydratase